MKKQISILFSLLFLTACSNQTTSTTPITPSTTASAIEQDIFPTVSFSLQNVLDGFITDAIITIDGKEFPSTLQNHTILLKDIPKNSILEISHPKYETKKIVVDQADLGVQSLEYPLIEIGKTRYNSSPLYNGFTLSSTRTLDAIRFRFSSPYDHFQNSKSALSLFINAKESKENQGKNDYEFKMTPTHLFVYDFGYVHSAVDLNQFSYQKEYQEGTTTLTIEIPYSFLGVEPTSIVGVSMQENLFEKDIKTELVFDEEIISPTSPKKYVRIDQKNRCFANTKNEDNPYWLSKKQYSSLIEGKDYSFASKKYCNHAEDCDDVHFSISYTEEKLSFDFVGFGEFKDSEYFQVVLHNNIIDKNAWQLCSDDVILQIHQDQVSLYSECEEFFSVQNGYGKLLKTIPLNSFIDYGPYFTLKVEIENTWIPNIHSCYDDIYLMAVEFNDKTLYDGVNYQENFFYQGVTLGDPADLANYACVDAPKERVCALTQEEKKQLIGNRNISFANPTDTKMKKADDFYFQVNRNDSEMVFDLIGFGDFSDTEIVTFVFHPGEADGEEWKIQKEDTTLMVSKEKARIVTGTTDFWVGTRITRGNDYDGKVNYHRFDSYFTLSFSIRYQDIGSTSTSKIRMYAFEFGFGGVLYNNDPWTKLMRKDNQPCGDPAFQRNYIEI